MLNYERAEERADFLRLKNHLGACGILFPVTLKQVRLFKKLHAEEKLPGRLYPDPMAIIAGDYREGHFEELIRETDVNLFESGFVKAAARNGKEIPEEVLRRMRKDRGE